MATRTTATRTTATARKTEKPSPKRTGSLYSVAELMPHIPELEAQAQKAHSTDPHRLTTFQKKIVELARKTELCIHLRAAFEVHDLRAGQSREELLAIVEQLEQLEKLPTPRVVPPQSKSDQWQPFTTSMIQGQVAAMREEAVNPATLAWQTILHDYSTHDVDGFNQAVADYRASLAKEPPKDLNTTRTDFEAFFNHAEPFFWAWVLDIVAFALTCCAWLGFNRTLNRMALWLLILTFAVHTLGLVARIYISGRPPVTNLYSSALFIGWAAMAFGITFELLFGMGIGNLIASVASFATHC